MKQENNHPNHPVRNFFYMLWSLLNAVAFVALFVLITLPFPIPYRFLYVFAAATVLLLALVFGFFRPLFRVKRQ